MADFPYTQVPGRLKTFLEKISQVGIPSIADKKWLASISFPGKNDQTIISVLKFIDFVDSSGKPTNRWSEYRDRSRSKKVLAEGITKGYYDLFNVYHNANHLSNDELRAFFSTKTTAGEQAITKTISTFTTLCSLATFEADAEDPPFTDQPEMEKPLSKNKPGIDSSRGLGSEFGININIQLTLPETNDELVYDKLFAAMKKHLLS